MTDEPYIKLREYLDNFPIGFPKTSTGVEIEILKRLFTEEEAKITVKLNPIPLPVSSIARRAKMDKKEMEEKLEVMSKKGLIFKTKRGGKTLYNAAPYMIGLYEYSVNKIDKDLAKKFKEYYDMAMMEELGASDVPGFKVLPESRLLGEGCDYPMEETCLAFGAAAEYYIENGWAREITPEECIEVIEKTDKAGLVHAGVNSKHLSNICNCCPCCCATMKGITQKGFDKHRYLNALFESIIDQELCSGCGNCVDRCPVDAIILDEFAVVNRDLCLGCGLCAGVCPEEAITLHLREDEEEPYERVLALGKAVYEGKKKHSK